MGVTNPTTVDRKMGVCTNVKATIVRFAFTTVCNEQQPHDCPKNTLARAIFHAAAISRTTHEDYCTHAHEAPNTYTRACSPHFTAGRGSVLVLSTKAFTAPEDTALSRRAASTGFMPAVGCPTALSKRRSCNTLMSEGDACGDGRDTRVQTVLSEWGIPFDLVMFWDKFYRRVERIVVSIRFACSLVVLSPQTLLSLASSSYRYALTRLLILGKTPVRSTGHSVRYHTIGASLLCRKALTPGAQKNASLQTSIL